MKDLESAPPSADQGPSLYHSVGARNSLHIPQSRSRGVQ